MLTRINPIILVLISLRVSRLERVLRIGKMTSGFNKSETVMIESDLFLVMTIMTKLGGELEVVFSGSVMVTRDKFQ